MILDTTFLIDLLEGDEKAVRKLDTLISARVAPTITAPSIVELFTGVTRGTQPEKEKEKLCRVLQEQMIVPLDSKAAQRAGMINGALLKQGKPAGILDTMIAAIAIELNQPVLTRNVKDFQKIPELRTETY